MSEVVGYGAFNYSETEQVVGKWIDGRPVYQKTINCGNLNGKTKTVPMNVDNLDGIIGFESIWQRGSNGIARSLPYVQNNYDVEVTFGTNSINLSSPSYSYSNEGPMYFTVRYTKTTDIV